jgi:ABC-type dipeptide/oligopeptide/nickel transport system, ATPase component
MDTLLEVRDLRTHFATDRGLFRAVDGISFSVPRGRTIGLVGESGCGKSVTSLSVMGLVPSPPGKVEAEAVLFGNRDMLKLSADERRKLRGGKIGVRENSADGGGLVEFFIEEALKDAGVDPATEVEMVHDPVFGYRNNPAHIDMLRSGKVNAITSSPPFSDDLEKEGYPVILDPNVVFPRRPGKVTVAPHRTIEQRSEELKAYFRAITRTFWFMREVNNFQYLHDLEARLRKQTHNDDEQRLFIASAPDRVDSWALPMDGGIERHALERIIQEMVKRGRLERPISVGEVFKDDAVQDAYRDISTRGELKPAFNKAMAVLERYGF